MEESFEAVQDSGKEEEEVVWAVHSGDQSWQLLWVWVVERDRGNWVVERSVV